MAAIVDLSLRGAVDHLRLAWQTGEALLELVEFTEDPEGTRYNVLVALQEMVTNVLRHAYTDLDEPVHLRYEADVDSFSVVLRDRGPAFDPLTATPRSICEDAMPSETGGWGIAIAREVMDDMAYRRDGEFNELTMRKTARSPHGSGVGRV
jgi:anti-sigma regulatory factor (Ser/Thr protein kinase)